MVNFNQADKEAYFSTLSAQDIIESLTLLDVKNFLESLGVNQISVNEEKQYLICPTICHNPINEAESMKLYWYHNNKIFRCYTECNEVMSIFELYKRYMEINYYPITLFEAENYVKQFLKHIVIKPTQKISSFEEEKEKFSLNLTTPVLKEYPITSLDLFTNYYHPSWLKDGIKPEVMDKFKIKFSLAQNKIIIPHFDINGRLIGIRGRALEKSEIENFGKYRPIQFGNILYTFPIQFNLYGIFEHKEGIKRTRRAIIAEAEKSVMLDNGFYDKDANCVACCGSTFNKYQINLLTNILGATEIIIALDKEYTDWKTERAQKYREKIEAMCNKYKNQATFSYIWDFDNLLEEKDSPFDKGKEIFEELYKHRIKIR